MQYREYFETRFKSNRNKDMTPKGKLTKKDKIGYGSAAIGDAIVYSFIGTYLLFFLTTVAGIQPAVAGAITVIAAVWDALTNPVIGYISDHASTRWGRRRPFMFFFAIPLFITLTLLFATFNMPYAIKVVYYGFMAIAVWTSFTGFFVPFYALGAEYTQDYDERSSLRAYASLFNMIGTMFSMVMPMAFVKYLNDLGMTDQQAWTVTAAVLGAVSAVSIVITAIVSKHVDTPDKCNEKTAEDSEKLNLKNLIREYLEVLSLKPVRLLLLVSLFFLISYSMIMSSFVYFFTFNKGADGNEISLYMGIRCLLCIALIPCAEKLCRTTDKRSAMLLILAACSILLVVFRIIPVNGIVLTMAFLLVLAASTSVYWQIVPAIFYDVCEYDEYETGQRREGAILAIQGLTEAIAAGLGTQILGIILQFAGFDGNAAAQTETALAWIYNCTTWVPVCFMVFAAFALYKFPITKKYYNHIVKELNERKKND